jgi:EpsI family protein
MAGIKLSRRALFVPLFIGGQAAVVRWAAGEERLPPMPDLSKFPAVLDGWKKLGDDPVSMDVRNQLRADQLMSRTYLNTDANMLANIFVAWFQSQRGGLSQPHSPQVCLPGAGWVPSVAGTMDLDTPAGTINVNRYAISLQSQKAVTLYWYQTPRRVIAGEWEAKFWILPDSLRDRRTDTALVRVFIWNGNHSDEETTEAAKNLARKTYPLLREMLPR